MVEVKSHFALKTVTVFSMSDFSFLIYVVVALGMFMIGLAKIGSMFIENMPMIPPN